MANNAADTALADVSSPVETIEVVIEPSAAMSVFEKPDFMQKVVNKLMCARGKGQKMLSVGILAEQLKVGERDLDDWGKEQKQRITRRVGSNSNIVYYGLAKPDQVVLGDSEFDQLLMIVLTEDSKMWKSLPYLAKQLAQDEAALGANLDRYSGILRRVGEGQKVYYALSSRFEGEKKQKKEKEKEAEPCDQKAAKKPVTNGITLEEVLALGMIHPLSDGFIRAMNFYGNRLAVRHPAAYAHLATAQKELSSGVALLMKGLGIKDKQMPDLESV